MWKTHWQVVVDLPELSPFARHYQRSADNVMFSRWCHGKTPMVDCMKFCTGGIGRVCRLSQGRTSKFRLFLHRFRQYIAALIKRAQRYPHFAKLLPNLWVTG